MIIETSPFEINIDSWFYLGANFARFWLRRPLFVRGAVGAAGLFELDMWHVHGEQGIFRLQF